MTDKLSNNTPVPFIPSVDPSVLPDSPPPQEVAVDPIPPLPSMSPSAANPPTKFGVPEIKVETVVEPVPVPAPVPVPPIPPTPLAPPVPEEDPVIRPPGASSAAGGKSGDPYIKKHHGSPKAIIAGIASLVLLVVALGSGLYLTRQKQQVKILADNCWCSSTEDSCSGCGSNSCIPNIGCDGNSNGQGTACCGGGPQPTNPPPSSGCVPYDGSDCGGDNQGFCTRCPDGSGGRTEYFCKPPNEGSGGGCRAPADGGPSPTPNYSSYEYITFTCDRCASDRRCQTPNIGVNPRYSTGSAPGDCAQVDRRPPGGNWEVVSLCSPSCSGPQPTSPPQPTATPTPRPGATATPTPIPPSATPTPETISANCDSLVAQMSDGSGGWVTKTDAEFAAQARPGDGVRFVCTGHKTQGTFTKSAFFINNILHVDDVVKLNENQFAVEYTIPAAGQLEVESVLLHDTKGWVD